MWEQAIAPSDNSSSDNSRDEATRDESSRDNSLRDDLTDRYTDMFFDDKQHSDISMAEQFMSEPIAQILWKRMRARFPDAFFYVDAEGIGITSEDQVSCRLIDHFNTLIREHRKPLLSTSCIKLLRRFQSCFGRYSNITYQKNNSGPLKSKETSGL